MARMRLWPATPHNPRICFTFDLLDWVEALMLECQVPLKDFCASLHFKCPYFFEKVSIKMLLDVYLYMIAIFSCLWLRERIYIFHFEMLLRLTGNYFSKFKHAVIIYCFIDSLNNSYEFHPLYVINLILEMCVQHVQRYSIVYTIT